MVKSIKIRKGVGSQSIAICVDARLDTYEKTPIEKGVINTGEKVYRPPLPTT